MYFIEFAGVYCCRETCVRLLVERGVAVSEL